MNLRAQNSKVVALFTVEPNEETYYMFNGLFDVCKALLDVFVMCVIG